MSVFEQHLQFSLIISRAQISANGFELLPPDILTAILFPFFSSVAPRPTNHSKDLEIDNYMANQYLLTLLLIDRRFYNHLRYHPEYMKVCWLLYKPNIASVEKPITHSKLVGKTPSRQILW